MIFPALCGGGALHIIPEDKLVNPDAFADYFEHHQIDCLKVVPSHLEALLTARHPEQVLPRLRLILGGEAAQPALLAKLGELKPQCEIFNHYGPTEATVGVLTFHVPKTRFEARAAEPAPLPLGRPIANTRVYVLDAQMQPVPPGIYGELYIGGAGVARGYHNHPELTAERFVPDSFSGEPGARLYRTGDVGRHLTEGVIEFAGRTDNQVKIAGQRIEPGEIEVALREHPAVREAVVVARDDMSGERGLAAYVVTQPETPAGISELRQHLRQRLPQYMQPAAFVMLDRVPLTANGKIDRRALPAPDRTRPEMDHAYEQPRTIVEEQLAEIWSEVLGLDHPGIHDNFFDLGGNSLLGTKMMARVRDRCQVELTLRNVFEAPTIAGLATLISARRKTPEAVNSETVGAPLANVNQLLTRVDDLPEAEVDSLLDELLAEEEAM
jgi:acyl-coenzyme A synthetase/AMP-(fatty) acid ligase